MVTSTKNKLVIEIDVSTPDTLLFNLLHDIPTLIQALQCLDVDFQDEGTQSGIATLLVLYEALLPSETEVMELLERRGKKKQKITSSI